MSNNSDDEGKTNRDRGLLEELLGLLISSDSDSPQPTNTTRSSDTVNDEDETPTVNDEDETPSLTFRPRHRGRGRAPPSPNYAELNSSLVKLSRRSSDETEPRQAKQKQASKHATVGTQTGGRGQVRFGGGGGTHQAKYDFRSRSSVTKVTQPARARLATNIPSCPMFKRYFSEAHAMLRSQIRKQEISSSQMRNANHKIEEALSKLQEDMLQVIAAVSEANK